MAPIPVKIRCRQPDGSVTVRKAALDECPTYAQLAQVVRQRFQLAPEQQIELLYVDEDGEHITFSSDLELHEYLSSCRPDLSAHVFILRLLGQASSPPTSAVQARASAGVEEDDWEFEGDEALKLVERRAEEQQREMDAVTPALIAPVENTDAASDPEDTPLVPAPDSIASRIQALVADEFPTTSASDDPVDEPLPSAGAATDMPFTGLPSAFASLLSGLPAHAGSFSSHLSSLIASPQSALGRLSTLAIDPAGALDLSDIGRSVAELSVQFSDAAREVVEGVRKEAEAVRGEFEQFKLEVEREKERFEDEVRRALEQAAKTPSPFAPRSAAPEPSDFGTAAADDDESATEADPEEPSLPVQSDATATPKELERRRAASAVKHAAKEARRIAREKRKQEKEARREERREARRAEKRKFKDAGAPAVQAPIEKHEPEGSSSPEVDMAGMPGGMPVQQSHMLADSATWASRYAPHVEISSVQLDDDRAVLLTNFLVACGDLGMDVRDAGLRTALTDIWCDYNGRGLSRMIVRACDELL